MKFIRSLQENNEPRSKVWLLDIDGVPWVHKNAPKYYIDNEEWALQLLADTGYVPLCERLDKESLLIEYIQRQPIGNPDDFRKHCGNVLAILKEHEIRHGDLTRYSVIPCHNKPYLVDWSESRILSDPRPDKRREGDEYWLMRTCEELCKELK